MSQDIEDSQAAADRGGSGGVSQDMQDSWAGACQACRKPGWLSLRSLSRKRLVSEVARDYEVARSWVYVLLERYRAEGERAFEPRSRRPKTSPAAISDATVDLIISLRKDLAGQGLDAGPETICWHLEHHHGLAARRL